MFHVNHVTIFFSSDFVPLTVSGTKQILLAVDSQSSAQALTAGKVSKLMPAKLELGLYF